MPFWKKKSNSRQAPSSSAAAPISDNADDTFLQQSTALIPAEVRMISGCHSEQTSADLRNVRAVADQLPNPHGRAGGACTSALLEILYRDGWQQQQSNHHKAQQKILTFQDLLLKLRESLTRSGLSQIPQLTSSRPMNVKETPFHLVGGTGRRRALLVGINYRGQYGELSGCHNDVFNMKKYIMQVHGFPEHDVTVLLDDDCHSFPTRQKIIAELRRLVAESMPGDSVYFHYSGHGGLLNPDFNVFKGKSKEYDETLIPLDHRHAGEIRDFSLFNHFVKPMQAGVTVTCIIDACHSGSVLDLPYSFRPTPGGEIRMRSSMDQLSNLAFLYILAGGMLLPHGLFHGVTGNIEDTVGGSVDDYQGTGLEDAEADGAAFGEGGIDDGGNGGYGEGDYDDTGYGSAEPGNMGDLGGEGDSSPLMVSGEPVGNDVGGDALVVPGEAVPDMQDPSFGNVVPGETVSATNEQGFGDTEYGSPYGDGFDYDGGDGVDADCGDCIGDVLGSLLDGG